MIILSVTIENNI
jgi:hypothetical protein